eukprot:COSAG02_NODE_3229_length_7139_cov_2.777273_7_plen_74_part_00
MAIKHDATLEQVPTGPKGNPEGIATSVEQVPTRPKGNPEGIATCPPNRDDRREAEVNQRAARATSTDGTQGQP